MSPLVLGPLIVTLWLISVIGVIGLCAAAGRADAAYVPRRRTGRFRR